MEDSRAILAIGRIERAMSRIERGSRDNAARLTRLQERNHALRDAVGGAIAEIDRLAGEAR